LNTNFLPYLLHNFKNERFIRESLILPSTTIYIASKNYSTFYKYYNYYLQRYKF